MKTLIALIFGWIWNIIKVLIVGVILSIIWPDIQIETVLAIMALYTVVMLMYKASKNK